MNSSDLGSPREMVDLTGRVIVVTGAGGGIGAGIVQRLSAANATVVAHTRNSPVNGDLTTISSDLTSPDGPSTVVAAAIERHGRLDGLVNNAGIQPIAPFAEITDTEWSEMIETNLTAVHRLTRAAAASMSAGGSIIHIASIEGTQPTPVHGHYATSKAGVIMHAKAAALSYGRDRIRVNAVSPGLIGRPGIEEQWPEGVERWKAAAPLERLGTPEDVGDACVFLCSDLSRWITGINLVVDGGVMTGPTW